MTYAEYLRGISFRYIQPHEKVSELYKKCEKLFKVFGGTLELFNTILPEDQQQMRNRVGRLCGIPRMSTYAIAAIINRGVADMNPGTAFVNVGVWNGFTLLAGMAGNPDKVCVGVDNFSQFGGPRDAFLERLSRLQSTNHRFYDMDYEEYFRKVHKEPIGFYIYDGEHSYRNQLRGLQIAEPFVARGGVILVDDTNVDEVNKGEPKRATYDFMAKSKHKYDVLFEATTSGNGHPTFWNGVLVLQKTT